MSDYVRFRPAGCCTALQMQRAAWLRAQPTLSPALAADCAAEWEMSVDEVQAIHRGELWCNATNTGATA